MKTTGQRAAFTTCGVILMATVMAIYNKYLVYGEFSPELWRQVGIAFCQKAPVAWLLQFFTVQKFAGQQTAKYPFENHLVAHAVRTGFTVLLMCPLMSLYSNLILMFQFQWSFGRMLGNWVPKMCVNWIFAYFVQIFLLGPMNRFLFSKIIMKWFWGKAETEPAH